MHQKSTAVRIIRSLAPIASTLVPSLAARGLERLFITPIKQARPPREEAWIATAQRSSVRFDTERTLAVYSWGKGPTVLLIHGWAGRGSQLGAYVAPLRARGFRVVTFDAPAHGESDGRTCALPEFATAVERVAQAMGPIDAIISHSLGTAAATLAVSRGLQPRSLVYIAPPEDPGGYLARAARELGMSRDVASRTQQRLERRYGLKFDHARGEALAPRMRVPLLVIHDEEDTEVPYREGQRLTARWEGAELMTIHGQGHRRIVRADEVVQAGVRFVAQTVPATTDRLPPSTPA